jgi:hypothetical protein
MGVYRANEAMFLIWVWGYELCGILVRVYMFMILFISYITANSGASLCPAKFKKRIYNRITMNFINLIAAENSPPGVVTLDVSWASDVLALIGILGAVATVIALWIRLEVKKNFNEIKAEFKPNGGSSLKDQVNRLEQGHVNLEDRFNSIDKKVDSLDSKVDTIVNFIIKTKDTE